VSTPRDPSSLPYGGYADRRRIDAALVREMSAVVLLILGAVGLVTAAFLQDRELGIATLSVAAIAAGVYLGLDR
jgi:hypothetical protein